MGAFLSVFMYNKNYERGFNMAQLDNFLIQLFHEGNCLEMYRVFGAHFEELDGQKGVRFTVYAPNARSVQVVGDFNQWNGENHYMENILMGVFILYLFQKSNNTIHINIVLKHPMDLGLIVQIHMLSLVN